MTAVVATAVATVVDGGVVNQVPVGLWYFAHDPIAVTLVFHNPSGGDVVWTFARDILADGVDTAAGIGDVRIWPWDGDVAVTLDSPHGYATAALPRDVVVDFLRRSYALVPDGTEAVDVDAVIARCLEGAGA